MIRYQSTSEFSEIVLSYRIAFSKRSWPYLLATVIPWLVLTGQRSVRRLGERASWKRHESGYYRFFSRFKFKPAIFFKILLQQIIEVFEIKELLIAVDDTLCPKWGRKIFGTAHFFDHVKRPNASYIWGHNWVVLAVVADLFGVPVALPFWVALYRPKKTCSPKEFRTRIKIVADVLSIVRGWFPSMKIDLVTDGAFNNKSLLRPLLKLNMHLVSRLRNDAVLKFDAPKPKVKKRGRKAHYGNRRPPLKSIARSGKGWQTLTVCIYGQIVTLNVKCFDAWWPKSGIKLRVVITKDPSGRRGTCFLSSTDLTLSPEDIIERFSLRWPIEQLFSDVKQHLGLDTAEVRQPKSVIRHAILAFASVTWTRIWAKKNLSPLNPPVSFVKQLKALRHDLIVKSISTSIPAHALSKKNSLSIASLMAA